MLKQRLIKNRKKTVIYNLSISYIVLLLIFIIFFMSYSAMMNNMSKKNAVKNTELLFSVFSKGIDRTLSENMELVDSMSNSKVFTDVMSITSLDDPNAYYSLYELRNELANYTKSFDIKKFYVYLKKIDMIVDANEVLSTNEYYQRNYKKLGFTYGEWSDKIKYGAYSSFSTLFNENPENNLLMYISLLPISSRYNKLATLVLEFNAKETQELFWGNTFSNGAYFVLNKHNKVVFSSSEVKTDVLKMLKQMNLDGDQEINGKKYYIKTHVENKTNMKYICMIDYSDIKKSFIVIWNVSFIFMILLLVLGGIIARNGIILNYSPIKRILKILSIEKNNERFLNEYDAIMNKIERIRDDNISFERQMKDHNTKVRDNLIAMMLRSPCNIEKINSQFKEEYIPRFKSDFFSVIIYDIINDYGFYHDDELADEEKFSTILFIFKNVLEEYVESIGDHAYVVEIDGKIALVVCYSEDQKYCAFEQAKNIADFSYKFFETELKIITRIAVAKPQHSISGIFLSYQEAIKVLASKHREENVLYAENDNCAEGKDYYYTDDMSQLISKYIMDRNYESAEAFIIKLLSSAAINGGESLNSIKYKAINILCNICKTYENLLPEGFYYLDIDEYVDVLLKSQDVLMIKNSLLVLLRKMNDVLNESQIGYNMQHCEIIEGIIKANYAVPQLDVSYIAEEIGMNRSYISTLFKKSKGETVADYINKYRLSIAKQLLKNTRMSIEEVSKSVGVNMSRLVRIFKKYEGITPAQYRNS